MAVLKGLVITAVGDVGPGKGNEQLRRWVEGNGGRWMPRIANEITHLICSKEAWKKRAETVQLAKEFGAFVVSYDWLEDCLVKRRKLKEKKYTWEVLRQQRKNSKTLKRLGPQADEKKFRQGCDRACEDTRSGTSTRKASSQSSRDGFFTSSLEDLARSREMREAEEETRAAAKAVEVAEITNAQDAKEGTGQDEDALQPAFNSVAAEPASPTNIPKAQYAPKSQKISLPLESQTSADQPPTPTPYSDPPRPKHTPPTTSQPIQSKSPNSAQPSAPPIANLDQARTNRFKDLYHVYLDNTGFNYHIICLRINPYLNNFAQYDLSLYESNTVPHVYCSFARYKPPAGSQAISSSSIAITPQHPKEPLPDPQTAATPTAEAEKTRLRALIEPPTPQPTRLHRALIAPLNSDFATAYRAFRHAFRDLTLLTWEERMDNAKNNPFSTQRLRAQAFNIEPFVWSNKPAPGMPLGVVPALPLGDIDAGRGGYVANRWKLPARDAPLGTEGVIGSAMFREAEAARKQVEEAKARREKSNATIKKKTARVDYSKPLFNGVNGPPTDPPARYNAGQRTALESGAACVRGAGSAVGAAAARTGFVHRPAVFTQVRARTRLFPSER